MTTFSRRGCAAAAVVLWLVPGLAAQTAAADPRWLVGPEERILDAPNLLPNAPVLVKSLGDAAEYVRRWKPPASAAEWRRRRPEVERAFRKAIGLESLPERTPLHARTLARHDFGDYTIENLIFESRPGFPVTANLYRPKAPAKGKRPAVLCPIGHYLLPGKAYPEIQARCIKLARMGFVVLVYDAIGHGERMVPGNIHHEAGYALLPLGETVAGWMVWDSMRGIDYLLSLAEVDPARIGVTGNSGGGLNTLFTAALDPRVSAATVAGYTFEFNNWLKYAGAHCTCTQLPGLFRAMEWFEIAGLIAPRPLLMLQGARDNLFPISGARRAGHAAEALYGLLGKPDMARFGEVPGEPHAYSRPYRERMYGWMARHLLGQGTGEPVPEGDVQPLDENDPRLLCDPRGEVVPRALSVVDLARKRALAAVARLSGECASVLAWVRELVAPPEEQPHFLAAEGGRGAAVPGGRIEKISFNSEDGAYIPGLLWLPEKTAPPARTVIVADSRGKAKVAESGLVPPLVAAGFAVLAVDLRGRGETLGIYRPGLDTNFRLVANQVLFGRPLAGRRAFDLRRAIDYVGTRRQLRPDRVAVVGLEDDALPVLLAAAADDRIGQAAMAGYFHSFVSQARAARPYPDRAELRRHWNYAIGNGRLDTGDYEVDLGAVIPASLETADIPDIAALVAPRKLLFAQARDARAPGIGELVSRFRRVTGAAVTYEPERTLDGTMLAAWLAR